MNFTAYHFDSKLDLVLSKITTRAPRSLSSLFVEAEDHPMAVDAVGRIWQVVKPVNFPYLAELSIRVDAVDDWAILRQLPGTLRELHIGYFGCERLLDDGSMSSELSLSLPHLQRCTLDIHVDTDKSFRVAVSFNLPCLQEMVLRSDGRGFDHKPLVFHDWHQNYLPDTCDVVCEWNMSFPCGDMSQHVWTGVEDFDLS